MHLIDLGKVREATKTIAEKQYQLCSRCDHATFHVRGDDIQNSSFYHLRMSRNGTVELRSQHGKVCQRGGIELLGAIGIHDMKALDPFHTVPCSEPRKWYQC